jgi:hypothetical protein
MAAGIFIIEYQKVRRANGPGALEESGSPVGMKLRRS